MTPTRDPNLSDLERELSARSLFDYLKLVVWPVVEPFTPFVGGFHIEAICEHLQAVQGRKIRDLLITVPPRHTKSICASVAFPTWAWIGTPSERFLFSSYSESLSTEHAVLSRRVLESQRYQELWGESVELQTDQNIKTHYENTRRGYRISTSITGTGTGRGGDILVMDDPHNLANVASDAERKRVIGYWRNVWSSRMNDPKTGCRVVIMQRGHQDDLAQYILDEGGWCHLMLPMEYDPRRACVTAIGWRDPRTREGELLCPERNGPAEVAKLKTTMTASTYATQAQQQPAPEEGDMFKRAHLRIIEADALPKEPYVECRAWDGAATEVEPGTDPDYTCGAKLRRYSSGLFVVVDVIRDRLGPAAADTVLRNTAVVDGRACSVFEEQEPGSAGKKLIAAHVRLLAGFTYKGEPSTGNKVTRAMPFAVQVDHDNVRLLRGEWNQTYINELTLFPNVTHDDQVDASAAAFNELALGPQKVKQVQAVWG